MTTASLLLVEDEAHLAYALRFNLEEEGYAVTVAGSLAEAQAYLDAHSPQLILLDVMLPDGDGVAFCASLRAAGNRVPVLMLTAKNAAPDVIDGLGAGADDYLGKPFDLGELLGRVAALLRRRAWLEAPSTTVSAPYEFGPHKVDFAAHRIVAEGREVNPTELELKLLEFFVANAKRVVSREELLEHVWGVSRRVHTRTIDNFIVRLRRIFEVDPSRPAYFKTVRGVGYRFDPAGDPAA